MDPDADLGGPKIYGSYGSGSGSATLWLTFSFRPIGELMMTGARLTSWDRAVSSVCEVSLFSINLLNALLISFDLLLFSCLKF
jgi:hypothetical protein